MQVGRARTLAIEWVLQLGSKERGFLGAYFSGSIVDMADAAELPESSDVDIVVVSALEEPPPKPGKFLYHGALLEVTPLAWRNWPWWRMCCRPITWHIASAKARSSPIPVAESTNCERRWLFITPTMNGYAADAGPCYTKSKAGCAV
jgi:hypothetical protein